MCLSERQKTILAGNPYEFAFIVGVLKHSLIGFSVCSVGDKGMGFIVRLSHMQAIFVRVLLVNSLQRDTTFEHVGRVKTVQEPTKGKT